MSTVTTCPKYHYSSCNSCNTFTLISVLIEAQDSSSYTLTATTVRPDVRDHSSPSLILSIGSGSKTDPTGVIHWPSNTVRKPTSSRFFFPMSLCPINYPGVVTILETQLWMRSNQILPWLCLFLECVICRCMGGVLPFFTAARVNITLLEWESHTQTYTNHALWH